MHPAADRRLERAQPARAPVPPASGRWPAGPPTAVAGEEPQSAAMPVQESEPDDQARMPQASASCSRVNTRAVSPGPGPGSAFIAASAASRPASRRNRRSSACIASKSARGIVTISLASPPMRPRIRRADRGRLDPQPIATSRTRPLRDEPACHERAISQANHRSRPDSTGHPRPDVDRAGRVPRYVSQADSEGSIPFTRSSSERIHLVEDHLGRADDLVNLWDVVLNVGHTQGRSVRRRIFSLVASPT